MEFTPEFSTVNLHSADIPDWDKADIVKFLKESLGEFIPTEEQLMKWPLAELLFEVRAVLDPMKDPLSKQRAEIVQQWLMDDMYMNPSPMAYDLF